MNWIKIVLGVSMILGVAEFFVALYSDFDWREVLEKNIFIFIVLALVCTVLGGVYLIISGMGG